MKLNETERQNLGPLVKYMHGNTFRPTREEIITIPWFGWLNVFNAELSPKR